MRYTKIFLKVMKNVDIDDNKPLFPYISPEIFLANILALLSDGTSTSPDERLLQIFC